MNNLEQKRIMVKQRICIKPTRLQKLLWTSLKNIQKQYRNNVQVEFAVKLYPLLAFDCRFLFKKELSK